MLVSVAGSYAGSRRDPLGTVAGRARSRRPNGRVQDALIVAVTDGELRPIW
jgi:hypothetical protein